MFWDTPRRLLKYRRRYYSQEGEDGILEHVLGRLPDRNNWCVEFGAWDGRYLSNTYHFVCKHDFAGVMIEGDKNKFVELQKNMRPYPRVVCVNRTVSFCGRDSLDNILKTTGIPEEFDLLSVDIDGNDYHVWESLREFTPKIVIIELNIKDLPGVERINEKDSPFVMGKSGTSISSMNSLAISKGYSLVCQVGCNAIFVRNKYYGLFHDRTHDEKSFFTYEFSEIRELTMSAAVRAIYEKLRRRVRLMRK